MSRHPNDDAALVLAMLACLIGWAFWPDPPTAPPVRPTPVAPAKPKRDPTGGLLAEHNRVRELMGRLPMRLNPALQAAAEKHADHMAKVCRSDHMGIGDGDPWSRMKDAGFQGEGTECTAWNQTDPPMVVRDWLSSPGHRRAVLGHYTDYGGAMRRGKNGNYWCSVYGNPSAWHPKGVPPLDDAGFHKGKPCF